LAQSKNKYKTIFKLNNTFSHPNLFMIHPGGSGCEVYSSLAQLLNDRFSCYGIDSYNLHQIEKIQNLSELAQYYLSAIENIMQQTRQHEFHLLGWSLGGQIALEIASILEQRGIKNIKIYLLDTQLYDTNLIAIIDSVKLQTLEQDYLEFARQEGFEQSYIDKVVAIIGVENILVKQGITTRLHNTEILLFKAMLEDLRIKTQYQHKLYQYSVNSFLNNIDLVVSDTEQIKTIHLTSVHHGNILNEENTIAQLICSKFANCLDLISLGN
jgi:pimeloyl-ACP methyl ester carboxylesterase